jgi:hypothetical protein
MPTTFNDEYKKALGERGLALKGKRSAIQMGVEADSRRIDLEKILFGDSTNYGVVSILSILYNQIWLGVGKQTSKPILHAPAIAKSQYQVDFDLSVTAGGDGSGGLHPPQTDNPDAGQDEVDPNSTWLTDHALEANPSGTEFLQLTQILTSLIGAVASVNGDGRGPYVSQVVAQAQAQIDRGSGILALRTENSEVYSTGTSPVQWWIGQNGIDTPDNFTFGSGLNTALTNLKTILDSFTDCLQQEQDMINGVNGAIIQEFHVDLPDDSSALEVLIPQMQSYSDQLQEYIDYFNQFSDPSPSANQSEINNKLSAVISYLSSVNLTISDRVNTIPGLLGDANSGVNKHLTFWISAVVAKPDGPYAMITSAQDMLAQAQINLETKDDNLKFFTSDYSEWIESPPIQQIYNRAVLNFDQQTVNRWETHILWNLILSANKYKILSRPFSQLLPALSNDPWDDSSGQWITDVLPTNFLSNLLTIPPPTETTIFRIIAYDTSQGDSGDLDRMDDFDTQSPQSDIVSGPVAFTQLANTEVGQSVIQVDASAGLKERDFLWINGDMIAQVMAIVDDQYALDTDYGTISSVQRMFGVYFIAPSSVSEE